uniref:RING-type domain-containing protein n=1 Tax=Sphaeramia orbicularis TaxID=375764 RepID=A0A672Z9X2_9TELE
MSQQGKKNKKTYNPWDPTMTFVDREDELDFECIGYTSPRALMSCGHAVTPMSLTSWCRRLLEEGQYKFVCGHPNCKEWSYEEVRKMALLTPEETKYFENQLFENAAKSYMDVKCCPGCNYETVRTNCGNLCVKCTVCTVVKKRDFHFCWQCQKEWTGSVRSVSDHCDNRGCTNEQLELLRTCKEITFQDVKGVTGCPTVRACPTCGELVEHNTTKCKNIVCSQCKVEFCFICLKLTTECLQTSRHFQPCSSGVAPRQTSIPVRSWH